jgi:hypothetical protein
MQYATLSHRWLPKPLTTLKTSNIHDFQVQLPLELLSQAFLDAFTVTRNAGLRHIWIDSLCIIQDSASDWATESLIMSTIYGN